MSKLFLVFALTSITGCGQGLEQQTISPSLRHYVDDFKAITGIEFSNTDIYYSEFDGSKTQVGYCTEGLFINSINIATSTYNEHKSNKILDVESIPIVLAHELGHCLFGLQHNDELRDDDCPVSIMYSDTVAVACYDKYKDEYYGELIKAAERGVY